MMARRKSIDIEGFSHAAPIPAACRIGNLVASGGIHGIDPPDEHARPARHTISADLQGGMLVQREIMAVVG
jgi:hypothetical protein